MKRIARIGALLLALLLAVMCVLPAAADEFDMAEAIENTSPVFTETLTVGETASVPTVAWTDVSYYVSDMSVLVLNGHTLSAKGEGRAYLAIVSNQASSMYMLYRYDVVKASANTNTNPTVNNPVADLLNRTEPSVGFSAHKSLSGVRIVVPIVLVIMGLLFVVVIASAVKSRQLDAAMRQLSAHPCEETAQEAARVFRRINFFVRWNLSLGSDSRGVHFSLWKHVFNAKVIPSQNIKKSTKEELRAALVKLNTWDLLHVNPIGPKDYARRRAYELDREERAQKHTAEGRDRREREEEENRLAAEAFGKGGEDNVWHNLQTLATRLDFDIYRNVRIRNQNTTSEIDAVVVTEQGGIFLLEIKSCGGKKASDGIKHVGHTTLREDPSNQIIRHQLDFTACFASLGLADAVTNVLVLSWPHGEERRVVDADTFAGQPYDAIAVDGLLAYLTTQKKHTVSRETKAKIAEKLSAFGFKG